MEDDLAAMRADIRALVEKVTRLEHMSIAHSLQMHQLTRASSPERWTYCRQGNVFMPR